MKSNLFPVTKNLELFQLMGLSENQKALRKPEVNNLFMSIIDLLKIII